MSTETIQVPTPGRNKFIVRNSDGSFDEYLIKLSDKVVGNFIEFAVAPAVRQEGFLSYNKNTYKVSLHDLLRNHVNVSKPYRSDNTAGSDVGKESTGAPTSVGGNQAIDSNQPGSLQTPGDEIDEESRLYWEEQVDSLYFTDNS